MTNVGRRSTRESRAARRAHRRRRFLAVAVTSSVVVGAGIAVVVATRSTTASRSANARVERTATSRVTTTTTTTTTTAPTTTTTLDPGSLPQTPDRPPSSGSELDAGVAGLFQAVVTDDPTPAMPFFFPLSAYLQVKAIRDPAGDWQRRLVSAYQLDIHELHARLGAVVSSARLNGIDVPATATWVQPGAEHNTLSYWRVYGARVRFTVNGRSDLFTIASMISWRGHWYVVHLARIA